MAGGIRLVAVDDVDLGVFELHEKPLVQLEGTAQYEWSTRRRDANTGSSFIGGVRETAVWNILFKPGSDESHEALLNLISGDPKTERRLLAERLDGGGTLVYTYGALQRIVLTNAWYFTAMFECEDSTWIAEEVTRTEKVFSAANDQVLAVAVPGNMPVQPIITIVPTTQRASSNEYAGWLYRKRITIAWDGPVPLVREPIRISLGDVTPLTPTKARVDGGDVRFILNGLEVPRSLVGWDTASAFAWIVVPQIEPGESLVYDMIYGNPNATNPPTLAYPDAPAIDILFSDNDTLLYPTDTTDPLNVRRGLWHLFGEKAPASADYDIPLAWRPALTNQVPDDPNNHGFLPYANTTAPLDGTQNVGTMRVHLGSTDSVFVRSNEFDGVELYSPMPIQSVNYGYSYSNLDNTGGAQVVLLARASSGDDWDIVADDVVPNGVGAQANATITIPVPARHIAFGVWTTNYSEWNEESYPDQGVTVTIRTDVTIERDDSDLSISIGSEEDVYDLASELRVGGGSGRIAPYRAILIGNARQDTGKGTPRVMLKIDQALRINPRNGETTIWSTDGVSTLPVSLVEYVPADAITPVVGWDNLGEVVESASGEWITLGRNPNTVENGTFDTDVLGWTVDSLPSGMTAAVSYDATEGGDLAGSLKLSVTPSTAGTGLAAKIIGIQVHRLFGQGSIDLSFYSKTTNANLHPRLGIRFYRDAAASDVITDVIGEAWTPIVSAENTRGDSFDVPENARSYRILQCVVTAASNQTGNVFFDDVRFASQDILVTDEAIGELSVAADVYGVYL